VNDQQKSNLSDSDPDKLLSENPINIEVSSDPAEGPPRTDNHKATEISSDPVEAPPGMANPKAPDIVIDPLQEDSRQKFKRFLKSFNFLYVGMLALVSVFIMDAFFARMQGYTGSLANEVIEIIKTLLFMASGYIFGERNASNRKDL
jgi:hypothetical protein